MLLLLLQRKAWLPCAATQTNGVYMLFVPACGCSSLGVADSHPDLPDGPIFAKQLIHLQQRVQRQESVSCRDHTIKGIHFMAYVVHKACLPPLQQARCPSKSHSSQQTSPCISLLHWVVLHRRLTSSELMLKGKFLTKSTLHWHIKGPSKQCQSTSVAAGPKLVP